MLPPRIDSFTHVMHNYTNYGSPPILASLPACHWQLLFAGLVVPWFIAKPPPQHRRRSFSPDHLFATYASRNAFIFRSANCDSGELGARGWNTWIMPS